jgi:hypothetical protein
LQALCPCCNVGLQVHGLLLCRYVVDPTGSGLVQVLLADSEQVRIQAPRQISKPVVLVSSCFVGSTPQGGWLLWGWSDSVRQKLPVRAASCRHVLPHVVGFPHR